MFPRITPFTHKVFFPKRFYSITKASNGFWKCKENQRKFLEDLAKKKNFKWNDPVAWGKVTQTELRKEGGGSILTYHKTFWDVLTSVFPEMHLCPLCTTVRIPPGYWENIENQRHFLDHLAEKEGFNPLISDNWKQISASKIVKLGGQGLLLQYSSFADAIISIYSECNWSIFDVRSCVPRGYWKSIDNQRKFFLDLSNKLQLNEPVSWADIPFETVQKEGGSVILSYYENYYDCIKTLFPEISSKEWSSQRQLPKNYWHSIQNQKKFLDDFAIKMNLKKPEDWKTISHQKIIDHGGRGLLKYYPSLLECLSTVYPDKEFTIKNLSRYPVNWWKNKDNHKVFLDTFEKENNIKTFEDWNTITKKDLINSGGYSLFSIYTGLYEMLSSVYPTKPWYLTRIRKPKNFWTIENQKNYIEGLCKYLSIEKSDVIHLTNDELARYGGSYLLSIYDSMTQCIESLYNIKEDEWKEKRITRSNFWDDIENQKKFLDDFAEHHNINSPHEWKDITSTDIIKYGGRGLIEKYNTWSEVLSTIYGFNINNLKDFRRRVSYNYWKDPKNVKSFIEKFEQKNRMFETTDWYRVSIIQLCQTDGGYSLLRRFGSIYNLLKEVYPNIRWNKKLIAKNNKRSEQWRIFTIVREIFPDREVIEEYNHPTASRESGNSVELDVFIPSLNLAIEYHGKHHYEDIPAFGPSELYQIRDNEKIELCQKYNIKLLVIPYFFKGSDEDLKELILNKCKEE